MAAAVKKGGVGRSWKESLIYEEDRVAILSNTGPESRENGKIGVVKSVNREKREVVIKGLNMVGNPLLVETSELEWAMVVASCFWLRLRGILGDDVSSTLTSAYDERSNLTTNS